MIITVRAHDNKSSLFRGRHEFYFLTISRNFHSKNINCCGETSIWKFSIVIKKEHTIFHSKMQGLLISIFFCENLDYNDD